MADDHIIRIIIRALNEASPTLAKLKAEAEALDKKLGSTNNARLAQIRELAKAETEAARAEQARARTAEIASRTRLNDLKAERIERAAASKQARADAAEEARFYREVAREEAAARREAAKAAREQAAAERDRLRSAQAADREQERLEEKRIRNLRESIKEENRLREEARKEDIRAQIEQDRAAEKAEKDRMRQFRENIRERARLEDEAYRENERREQRLQAGRDRAEILGAGAGLRPSQRSEAESIARDRQRLLRDRQELQALANDARRLGSRGTADLERFELALRSIDNDLRSLDRDQHRLERAAGIFGGLAQSIQGVQASLTNASPAAGALLGVLAPVLSIVVALAGGLVALAASAAAAAAAIGGALVTALGVAAPGVLLLVAAIAKLVSLFQLASQQSAAQQKQDIKQAKTATDNANAIANAQDSLAAAQRRLTEARKQAVRNLEDLILAEKEAKLAFLDSVRARDQAVRKGNVDALPGLELQVQRDRLGRDRAVSDANTARQQGIAGNPGVVAAQQGVVQAQRALADALKGTADAGVGASAALDLVNDKISKLTPVEKRLFDAIVRLRAVFKTTFSGILAPILDGFTSVINGIISVLKDPRIQAALRALAGAMGRSIAQIGAVFTGPEGRKLLLFFTRTLTESLPTITRGFAGLIRIFGAIAVAAKPIYDYIVKGFGSLGDHLSKSSRNSKPLADFFKGALGSLKLWVSLLGSIFGLFGSIFKSGGKAAGDSLVSIFTKALDQAADWIDKHPREVKAFFDQVIEVLRILGGLLIDVGAFLIKNLDAETVRHFANVFSTVLLPAIQGIVDISRKVIEFLDYLSHIPGVSELAKLAGALFVLNRATGLVSGAFAAFRGAISIILGLLLGPGGEGAAAALGGPIAIAILAIAAGIYLLDKRFHFIAPTINFIKRVFGEMIDFVSEHWKGLIQLLLPGLGSVVVTIVNHFDTIKAGIKVALEGIKELFDWLKKNVWDRISGPVKTGLQAVYKPFKTLILGIIGAFDNFDLANALWSGIKGMVSVAASVFTSVRDAFMTGLGLILDGVRSILGAIDSVIGTSWAKSIPDINGGGQPIAADNPPAPAKVSVAEPVIPDSLKFAQGGFIPARQGGQTIIVSEAGHGEWVVPSDPKMAGRRRKLLEEIMAYDKEPFGDAGLANTPQGKKRSGVGGRFGGEVARDENNKRRGQGNDGLRHLLNAFKAAKYLDDQNIPYSYGGGHSSGNVVLPGSTGITSPAGHNYSSIVGLDCSSSVSYVMQQAGYSFPTQTSGEIMGWGDSGPGLITLWANPTHVFMDIAGRRYGTGGGQPGGGFGLNDHSTSGFTSRHPADLGHKAGILDRGFDKLSGLTAEALDKVLSLVDNAKQIVEDAFPKLPNVPILSDLVGWIKDKMLDLLSDPTRWFAQGGFIPGTGPQPIVGHGGELVLTAADQRELLDGIRAQRGRKGGGGARIGGDIFAAIARITGLDRGSLTRLGERLRDLFGDGGLFDQLDEALQRAQQRFARSRVFLNLRQRRDGQVVDRTNPGREARATVTELETENRTLDAEAASLRQIQTRLQRRYTQVRNALKGASGDRKKKLGALLRSITAGINNITGRLDSVQDALAANLQSLYDAQTAVVQAIVDSVTERAQRRLGAADIRRRMRTFLVGADQAAVEFSRGQVRILSDEARGLRSAIRTAQRAGKTRLANELKKQLDDLNASIKEAVITQFQATVDQINNRASQRLSIDDVYAQIAALGGSTPFGTGDAGVKAATRDKLSALQTQGKGLADKLAEAIKKGLGPDVIGALQLAVAENTLAQLQTKAALDDLNGTMTELQGFTSTSWQWFRQAVFNGTGGLMSQYAIPSAATGADIMRGGLLRVHDNETVVPAQVARRSDWGKGDINQQFNIYQNDRPIDTRQLGDKMAFELDQVLS